MAFIIITVLAAMLLPLLKRAKGYAHESLCMDNTRQIALSYRSYMHDHNNEMPFVISPGTGSPGYFMFLDDFTPVYPYIKSVNIFKCPSSTSNIKSYDDLVTRKADYLCAGNFLDIELKSQKNNGHGNNVYSFDPSNPGMPTKTAMANKAPDYDKNCNQRIIYERYYPWHLTARAIFAASIDDLHCYKETRTLLPYWMLNNTNGKIITGTATWPSVGNWPQP